MRLRSLDGVRAIAVLATMAVHSHVPLGRAGYLGVDIFFVLSGYLITTILVREHARTGRLAFGTFYLRRMLRLYPALIALCLVAVAVPVLAGFTERAAAARASAYTLTYLGDLAIQFDWPVDMVPIGQVWSLGIEEQFYLLWPLVLLAALRWRHGGLRLAGAIAALGTACSLAILIGYGTSDPVPFATVYFRPDARAGAILVGCVLAIALRQRPNARVGAVVGWTCAAGLVALLSFGPEETEHAAYAYGIPATWLLATGLLAHLVTAPERPLSRALSWRPLVAIGVISYGLYLVNPLVYNYIGVHVSLSRHVGVLIAAPLSILIAALSYRFLELPFLRRKARLRSPGSLETTAPAAAVKVAT